MIDIIILFCTSVLGFLIGKLCEGNGIRREKLYLDLLNFTKSFRVNAVTSRVVLTTFVDQFCKSACDDFVVLSNKALLGLRIKTSLLSEKELQYLSRFFSGLDAQNSKALAEHLDFFEGYFAESLTRVRADNNSKGSVGQKLGLLCGVIVGLILI